MTIRNTMKWILAALLVAGCGGSKSSDSGAAHQPPSTSTGTTPWTPTDTLPTTPTDTTPGGNDTTPPVGDAADPDHAYVRVLGVTNPGYDLFSLEDTDLDVWVDGEPVAVDDTDVAAMNLAEPTAYLAGRFALPQAGAQVRVRLVFDDYGAYKGPPGAGAIDARGLPIEFTVPSELFLLGHHAVIWLDLSRSLVPRVCEEGCGEEAMLLPTLEVSFY